MAEVKTPSYNVKHIDGVMHLTLQGAQEPTITPEKLRVNPPVVDHAE